MPTYKTPNVYVEEISTFPPSVAEVSTAIPAFIGYTEKAQRGAEYLTNIPTRIGSILDYETLFGKAQPTQFEVTPNGDAIASINDPQLKYLMYYALRLYFDNGGGSCYIVSVGQYSTVKNKADFEAGLSALEKEDEPTLILLTDAVNLSQTDYYELCQKALAQCNKLKDRFAILDVLPNQTSVEQAATDFRNNLQVSEVDFLKYGAAYYPYLQTSLNYYYTDDSVTIQGVETTSTRGEYKTDDNGILVTYTGSASNNPKVSITVGQPANGVNIDFEITDNTLTIKLPSDGASVDEIVNKWQERDKSRNASFQIESTGNGSQNVTAAVEETPLIFASASNSSLGRMKTSNTDFYNKIKTELTKKRVVLPPSAAVAGIYARVDRDRGVWKAPANVSLASVLAPTIKISNDEQENLNVDPTAGKSINAIRSFTGKGTLIWGARTLAGNDNEWRYIPVRRLFNLIEESIQKATSFVVFESNNAITWLKVKSLIESYLEGLWRQGALAGTTPEQAFFVNIGLGKSMTQQDVLEGRMIVEIGIAAVRPAEFIILKFSHKLQEV
ncbi:phage tail sheath family protein [Limnoraphis robusta]|uniref:Phage tail sheath C-terminal domain-containing protein n=1 Tax=Limnoraphis robusta CCNP1315 TaxID=3110306 RepID=A0ABU5U2I4_9CYAN|nr:phage tail sheath C-terminal domain-containing protein [Limnoraphis robusta]MEA5521409.1 phage tail sheath C-terminal domain-containing protein [Limnoraphis robusta CCNP1315]MEA5544342.1 phage tail sheath C-terminal domain-containing protein [Limnoraphis robusta CCNP1324]